MEEEQDAPVDSDQDSAAQESAGQDAADALTYLKGEMNEADRTRFEERLIESESLREELARSRRMLDSIAVFRNETLVSLVNNLIRQAVDRGASDLHLVPQKNEVVVSVRVDGFLSELSRLPIAQMQSVVDRWKEMADMNLAERRLPQDGRIPLKIGDTGQDIDLRVNIIPTLYGERVTVRILNRSAVTVGLDCINLSPTPLDALRRLAKTSSGMIMTSGSTGSGKTTLLYSLLLEIQAKGRSGRNLMTVEDPVEYALGGGIAQTPVNRRAGLTFANVLRAMLRADPDVILCGAMRDLETAEIGIEMAVTGHLLLSTLHTTSAVGIIQRLRDMGLESFLIADVLVAVIAQRLVRKIDTRRTEEYLPAKEELEKAGLTPADGPFRRGLAIDENGGTGFAGRVPLVEVVEITPKIRRMIAEKASMEEIANEAFAKNRTSLRDDARCRIRAGLTTVEEVNWALFDYPF